MYGLVDTVNGSVSGFSNDEVASFFNTYRNDPATIRRRAAELGIGDQELSALAQKYGVNLGGGTPSFEQFVSSMGVTRDQGGNLIKQGEYGGKGQILDSDTEVQLQAAYQQALGTDAGGKLPYGTDITGSHLARGYIPSTDAPRSGITGLGEGNDTFVGPDGKTYMRVGASQGDIANSLNYGKFAQYPKLREHYAPYLQDFLSNANVQHDPSKGYYADADLWNRTIGEAMRTAPDVDGDPFFSEVLPGLMMTMGPAALSISGLSSFLPSFPGAEAGGSFWDEAGNLVNAGGGGGPMFWDEAGNLVGGGGAGAAATASGIGSGLQTAAKAASTLASGVNTAGSSGSGSNIPAALLAGAAGLGAGALLSGGGSSGGGAAPGGPDYTNAVNMNADAIRFARDAATDDFNFRNQVWSESKPRMDALLRLAGQVAEQQLGLSNATAAAANSQWNQYSNAFKPVETSMAMDSFGGQYLSPSEAAQLSRILSGESGLSPGEAQRQAYELSRLAEARAGNQGATRAVASTNAANAQAMRAIQRMGGDPSKFAAAAADFAGRDALVRTDASNRAREGVRDRTTGLRVGAANFGRNVVNTAGQLQGLSAQIGNSAVSNAQTGANSNLPFAQFRAGATPSALGAAALQQQGALGTASIQSRDYATGLNYALGNRKIEGEEDDALFGTALGVGNLALGAYKADLFG